MVQRVLTLWCGLVVLSPAPMALIQHVKLASITAAPKRLEGRGALFRDLRSGSNDY